MPQTINLTGNSPGARFMASPQTLNQQGFT